MSVVDILLVGLHVPLGSGSSDGLPVLSRITASWGAVVVLTGRGFFPEYRCTCGTNSRGLLPTLEGLWQPREASGSHSQSGQASLESRTPAACVRGGIAGTVLCMMAPGPLSQHQPLQGASWSVSQAWQLEGHSLPWGAPRSHGPLLWGSALQGQASGGQDRTLIFFSQPCEMRASLRMLGHCIH